MLNALLVASLLEPSAVQALELNLAQDGHTAHCAETKNLKAFAKNLKMEMPGFRRSREITEIDVRLALVKTCTATGGWETDPDPRQSGSLRFLQYALQMTTSNGQLLFQSEDLETLLKTATQKVTIRVANDLLDKEKQLELTVVALVTDPTGAPALYPQLLSFGTFILKH